MHESGRKPSPSADAVAARQAVDSTILEIRAHLTKLRREVHQDSLKATDVIPDLRVQFDRLLGQVAKMALDVSTIDEVAERFEVSHDRLVDILKGSDGTVPTLPGLHL